MREWFRRPRALFTAWIIYWIGLVAFGLGPAIAAVWRATQGPAGDKSSVNVAFGDWVFKLTVVRDSVTTYTGSIHLLAAALWVAVPPLVIWLLWLVSGARREGPVRV